MDAPKDKSPGSDGLTWEFYKFFWPHLEGIFLKTFAEIKQNGELIASQKKALIKLIYKKNGRHKLKNYRPISLLNTDLKIISKVLAKRLIEVLKDIIHPSQKCIPGRQITDNIHLAQDLIDLINRKNEEAGLIFLDQEKAFDRISHTFIFKTLKTFGFGDDFIDWIKIMYAEVNSQLKINGEVSEKIYIKRGLRQGCPLSALLYALCSEVLHTNIRKDNTI